MKTIATAFDALWTQQRPFVFFRLPEAQELVLYYQKDDTLHYTQDLKNEGFVFAPFKKRNSLAYIPAAHKLSFSIPNTPLSNSPLSLKTNANAQVKFTDLVEKTKQALNKKGLQKIVVSRAIKLEYRPPLELVLQRLLCSYPDALVYFWSHPKIGTWFGATPEILCSMQGPSFHTMALAATQSFQINNVYEWSAKEKKEQQLVTQQILEDLSTFIDSETLQISPSYCKPAGNVVHLCTDIKAERKELPLRKIIDALHPTPAVGGIPKKEALDFILKEEGYDRHYYTGFLGPFSPSETHLFVNLRSALVSKNSLTLFVGAGITAESQADQEWEETQRKAETLLAAL